jgi:hypothetical protein
VAHQHMCGVRRKPRLPHSKWPTTRSWVAGMPRVRLTKSAIEACPPPLPSRCIGREPTGLRCEGHACRAEGVRRAVSDERRRIAAQEAHHRTIWPCHPFTWPAARRQRVLAARTEGRDPAPEKREARRRLITDGVAELVEACIKNHVSKGAPLGRPLSCPHCAVRKGRSHHRSAPGLPERELLGAGSAPR